MKAMILAAGEGRRMRPLTDDVPKALLPLDGKPMIEWVIERLAGSGVLDLVINLHHHGDKIEQHLEDGRRLGVTIEYVKEPELLETGGGILNALSLLGDAPFLVVSADAFTDFNFTRLNGKPLDGALGHLVMVDNPPHHPAGDFAVDPSGRLSLQGERLTYAGISLLAPALFAGAAPGRFPLRDLLLPAIEAGKLAGEHFRGQWIDVGTPERYREAQRMLRS
ncbi:MAG: nucleotidyltransferase family protein [Pseudomonadales bacterium]|nr:nucleotidyltransferase family protein [Pseudomonadales bacterium]